MPLQVNDSAPPAFRVSPVSPVSAVSAASSTMHLPSELEIEARLEELGGPTFVLMEDLHKRIVSEIAGRKASFAMPVTLETINLHGRLLPLRRELMARLEWGPEELRLEVPELDILVTGPDITSLQSELFDEVEVLVEKFLHAPDSELAPSGIDLKRKLRELLGD